MATPEQIANIIESLHTIPEESASRVPVLLELLVEEGHDRHEDVVFELGLIGDSRAVPAIAKAVNIPFAVLVQWGNLHEFQRKCAYALARIGTSESKAVLEDMARSSDAKIRKYGKEGLSHWPMPFKAR
ncbi:HEAT repeat domain-containing protein [Acidovorax cavernicola]|uniref:HEAT repeat domain-containing protein n=1 Tax=Acidovorax cavernicola TaxID=1675792 RepID=A0A9X8D4Y2_9BURK|nr:HEAT repeat domain-containing protein [Acidovorax cavernicola]RIX79611.1 HEAT repeat domain-containing protein [Acidovorax cavernicola]